MNLVVEDGAGRPNANSYCSVSQADDYARSNRRWADDWTASADADRKAVALRWSTRLLDQTFRWRGVRTTEVQALEWPRFGTYRRGRGGGYLVEFLDAINSATPYPSNSVPQCVRDCCSELAILLDQDDRAEMANDGGVQAVTLGRASVTYGSAGADRQIIPQSVVDIVSHVVDFEHYLFRA